MTSDIQGVSNSGQHVSFFQPGVNDVCMGVTWYMANDMQFFLISPLIFVPLFFFKVPGLLFSGNCCNYYQIKTTFN